jgi:hypothetical protein
MPMCREFSSSAGTTEVEKPDDAGGKAVKPIPPKSIQECVQAWTKKMAQHVGAWAYDGRNNMYALKTLTDPHSVKKDGYQEFPVEIVTPGKKHPSRYQCAPSHLVPDELARQLLQTF